MEIVRDMTGWRTIIFQPKWMKKYFIYGYIGIHLLPSERVWGYEQEWYDGPHHTVGLGPLLMVVWD